MLETIIEFRHYARAKAALDARGSDPWDAAIYARVHEGELTLIEEEGMLDAVQMPMLLTRLAAKHPVVVHYVTGHWMDVDTLEDLSNARNFT